MRRQSSSAATTSDVEMDASAAADFESARASEPSSLRVPMYQPLPEAAYANRAPSECGSSQYSPFISSSVVSPVRYESSLSSVPMNDDLSHYKGVDQVPI